MRLKLIIDNKCVNVLYWLICKFDTYLHTNV